MSSDYWQERERIANELADADLAKYDKQARAILNSELKEIQKEIEAFYQHYANENGMTLADAKAAADKVDLEHYGQLAKQYVADHDVSEEANKQMELYNLRLKTSRLKYLQACINLQIVKHSEMANKAMKEALYESSIKEYQRQAGIFGMDLPNLDNRVQQLIDGSFHGANWSKRIWKHQKQLRSAIFKVLQQGLIQGKPPRDFVGQIAKQFDVSKSASERLLRTEFARVQVGAQLDSIKESGATEAVFINAEDPNVCPHCRELDGKHWPIKDLQVGENQPPIHPNCRCSLGAYYGDNTWDLLDEYAADPNADNMTFEQWKAQREAPKDAWKDLDPGLKKLFPNWKEPLEKWGELSDSERAKYVKQFQKEYNSPPEPSFYHPPNIDKRNDMTFDEMPKWYREPAERLAPDHVVYKQPDSISGVERGKPMTFEQADTSHVNPDYYLSDQHKVNCQSCVPVFMARLLGYDIKARPKGSQISQDLAKRSGASLIDPKTGGELVTFPTRINSPTKLYDYVTKEVQPGQVWQFSFSWSGYNAGHTVVLMNEGDGPFIYDPQRPEDEQSIWKGKQELMSYFKRVKYPKKYWLNAPKLIRMDDKLLNPKVMEGISES